MIRTAYPLSPLRKVQERLELATRRTRRALQARRHDLAAASSSSAPAALPPAAAAVPTPPAVPARGISHPAVPTEKAAVQAFYDTFDALTGLICLAAQEGVTPLLETKYRAARQEIAVVYSSDVQNWAAPYLEAQGADSGDTFAHFWTPSTLAALLQNDDGILIVRMEQALYALAAWEKSVQARTGNAARLN